MSGDPMSFRDVLEAIATDPKVISVLSGFVFYYLMDYLPKLKWFEWIAKLSKKERRYFFGALCITIPVVASVVRIPLGFIPPPTTFVDFLEYVVWPAVLMGWMAFGAATLVHAKDLKDDDKPKE